MKVKLLKKAFHGGHIIQKGREIEWDDNKELPSWAEPVDGKKPEPKVEEPKEQTLHEMAKAGGKSKVAKPSLKKEEKEVKNDDE